jgi:hypothetical protein
MPTNSQHSAGPGRPPILAILLVPLAVAVVLALFAWPSAKQEPRDLPVAVAGPPAAVQAMEKQLTARDGAFDVQRYPDEAAARDAIEDRDVYGAFVATESGQKVLRRSLATACCPQSGVVPRSRRCRPRARRAPASIPPQQPPLAAQASCL